jgi:acetyl esterase
MARDQGGPHLIYQVPIYPSLDAIMTVSQHTSNDPILNPDARVATLAAYVPLTKDIQDSYISPIDAKSLKNLPPAFIVTDEDDPARDEGDAYATRLRVDGVAVTVSRHPNMIHGFFLMAGELDAGKQYINEIAVALTNAFKSAAIDSQVPDSQE